MPQLEGLIPFTRRVIRACLYQLQQKNSIVPIIAVDGTAGNGHDTVFLAQHAGETGQVWAFDVQETALAATRQRLEEAGLMSRVTLVNKGHEHLNAVLPPLPGGQIHAAMFNLGFLPGGIHDITTKPATSIMALQVLLPRMVSGAICSIHCYTGHAGGQKEYEHITAYLATLPWDQWRVASYTLVNKEKNQEILFLAERLE